MTPLRAVQGGRAPARSYAACRHHALATGSRRAAAAVSAATLATALAGCSASQPPTSSAGSGTRHLTVLAASSLTEAFTAVAHDFEREHPGTTVALSFAASSTIVAQVNQGAPADLVALAGAAAATPLRAGTVRAGGREVFATNTLEIATPPANPARVGAIQDLGRSSVDVVLCAVQVPCGKAAAAALAAAKVSAHVVSYEQDVKAALTKVELGEADAAVVYHSDLVTAGGRAHGVPLPANAQQTLSYPLLRLTDDATARAFQTFVLSKRAQQRLRDSGLAAP